MVISAVADELAALGPFFAVQTHPAGSAVAAPWRPMSELTEDPALLRERVAATRAHLAASGGRPVDALPTRVAASVAQLGLVARLVSPALALALLTGATPSVELGHIRWQPALGGTFQLSLPEPGHGRLCESGGGPPDSLPGSQPPGGCRLAGDAELELLADSLSARVLNGPVRELVEAARAFSVSHRILWGNVASAVNGAATVMALDRPAWATPAHRLAAALLARPPLVGTGTWTPDGRFRRRSCCLIYQATSPPGGRAPGSPGRIGEAASRPAAICGDCVLARDEQGAAS